MEPAESADKFGIYLPLNIGLIAGAIIIGLTGIYAWTGADLRDDVVFFAAAAAGVGTILTALYTARTLNHFLAAESRRANLALAREEFLRKWAAMRFGERWNHPGMFEARDVLRKVMLDFHRQPQETLLAFVSENQTIVIHILNFLEELCFAVEKGVVDSHVLRSQFEGIVVTAWTMLQPWIEVYRKQRSRPAVWCELEVVYGKWRNHDKH